MAEGTYVMSEQERRRFARVISRAWSEPEFADRYAARPHAVLAEHGIDYPHGVAAPPLPPRPAGELNLEALESVAGMAGGASISSMPSQGPCYPCGTASLTGTDPYL